MAVEAVADSGPLIALARLGHLDLLAVLDRCWVTESVLHECVRRSDAPGASEIQKALGHELVRCADPAPIPLPSPLGPGERTVIALALDRGIDALLDERLARRVARRRGVGVFGLGALLIRSKEVGRLDAVRPILDRLSEIGYRLSPRLRAKLCELAGED